MSVDATPSFQAPRRRAPQRAGIVSMTSDNRDSSLLVSEKANALSRRSLLKAGAAGMSLAVTSPFVARQAIGATSGEVKIFAWAGYITPEMLTDFEKKTGIKPTYTPYGTNDELLNQLRANQGGGFDLIMPTVDRVPNYVELNLVQPIDEKKVKFDGVIASSISGSEKMGGVVGGKRFLVPSDWGTEAITFDTSAFPLKYGEASFGDIWEPKAKGKATVRGHSGLVGLGLFLERQGKLPMPMRAAFESEDNMKKVYDVILKEAIARKANIVQFWTNENEAQGAFRVNGAQIGQTWDSTAAALEKEGLPVKYLAPVEGALAWMEGFALPAKAQNLEQAYAFINWFATPEAGAMYSNATAINSTSKGADQYLSDFNKKFFAAAYPGDALQKLWWWPVQEAWFIKLRGEYADKWKAA
jgi:spermidine/putrescine transport system substrate-binding protein